MNFQGGVEAWMGECFPPNIVHDHTERGDRLLEEVLELLQSHGYDRSRVTTLVDYVYGRPVGEPAQEVGGVMVTLAAYCMIAGLNMHDEGERELARITQPDVMAKIRRKQESKNALHFDTPLPGNAAAKSEARGVEAAIREVREAEIFSDGVEADLHMAGIHGEAAAFMAGRLAALDELTDTLAAAPAAPGVRPSFTKLQAWALANGHSGVTDEEAYAVWRAANAPGEQVDAEALAQEWLKYARDLRGDGCYSCCAGTYEHCAAHLKALFGKCPHPGCKFTDGKPCAYAHCPQQGSIESTSR